jgi:hypothetical protein
MGWHLKSLDPSYDYTREFKSASHQKKVWTILVIFAANYFFFIALIIDPPSDPH